jgi:hypothetical protein
LPEGWLGVPQGRYGAVNLSRALDGEVRLLRLAKDDSEIALHRARRGDFFAEAALNAPRYRCKRHCVALRN